MLRTLAASMLFRQDDIAVLRDDMLCGTPYIHSQPSRKGRSLEVEVIRLHPRAILIRMTVDTSKIYIELALI